MSDNVVQLFPGQTQEDNESLIKMLENTLEEAKAGKIHLLVLVGRMSDGVVAVRASTPCDEVHTMGLLEVSKLVMMSRLRPG